MHDIFISYSRRDTETMNRVSQYLRDAGLTVWTDKGIEPGTLSWKQSLSEAILQCQYVVVLFSPNAPQSTWILRELDFAELHHKKLFPLLIEGEPADSIPFGYTTYQFVDIRDVARFNESMQSLLKTMDVRLAEKARPSTTVTVTTDTNLWQWCHIQNVHFTLPYTWKTHDPTPENIQKLQILMMGKDETLFYRAIEDFGSNFVKQVTGSPLGSINSLCTMSSISDLSPIAGFLAEYRTPFFTPGIMAPLIMRILQGRITKFLQTRYRSQLSAFKWTKSDAGRIWSVQWGIEAVVEGTQAMRGKVYTIFPSFARRSLFLSLICEASHYDEQIANFEQVVRSIQFNYD